MSETTARPEWWQPHYEGGSTEFSRIGRDPRHLSVAELEGFCHRKEPLLRLIRRNCIDCAGGNEAEVRRCAIVACPFWPYRMATNPFAAERELSGAQRAALAAAAESRKRARLSCPTSMPATFDAGKAAGGIRGVSPDAPAGISVDARQGKAA